MDSISDLLQARDDKVSVLLNGLLRHLSTISVAAIGFLLSVRSAGLVSGEPIWLYRLALCGFFVSVLASLYGQISVVSAALQEQSKFPKFLLSGKFWFICAWAGFVVAVGALFVIAL